MSIKVSDIMSQRVVTLEMDDCLSQAKEIFDHVSFHHLPVTEDELLVGIITKNDMEYAISPYIGHVSEKLRDIQTLDKKIHQVMTRNPISLDHNMNVVKAGEIMLDNGISCLPVINREKKVLGIITWRDLLKACLRQLN